MQWPAGSQDLNPIENVWDRMMRRVRALQPPPATLGELGEQIIVIWDNQDQADVLSSINSMGRRCEAVLLGGNICY
jgi:transposase